MLIYFQPGTFIFFGFFFFLLFFFCLSLFLLELNPKIGKLQLDHIVDHFLDLVFNFRQDCLFYLFDLGFVLGAGLILPLACMFLDLLLHDENSFGRTASGIVLFEFIFFCDFLFLFALALLFLLGLSQFEHHLLLFWS